VRPSGWRRIAAEPSPDGAEAAPSPPTEEQRERATARWEAQRAEMRGEETLSAEERAQGRGDSLLDSYRTNPPQVSIGPELAAKLEALKAELSRP
jgi:hypothetical protein